LLDASQLDRFFDAGGLADELDPGRPAEHCSGRDPANPVVIGKRHPHGLFWTTIISRRRRLWVTLFGSLCDGFV
jgi:hypothetical protein